MTSEKSLINLAVVVTSLIVMTAAPALFDPQLEALTVSEALAKFDAGDRQVPRDSEYARSEDV